MNEALVTSASRKIVPLNVSGMISQSGRRNGAVTTMTIQTAMPRIGVINTAGNFKFAVTFAVIAVTRIAATISALGQKLPRRPIWTMSGSTP